jgi:ribonuclease J
MTSITVLAGERTIGGTQIIVEDKGARLLFDCGIAYDPAGNPFGHVGTRAGKELADLLALRLAPTIPNLYAPEHVAGLPSGHEPSIPQTAGPLAVALSHSHLDHTHLLGFVSPDVPVYAAEPTARITQILSDTGSSLGTLSRPLIPVEPGDSFSVGPMRVRFLPVDHDVGGASAMLIETADGVIAYSGDIRLHGPHPERSLRFAREAREAGARLLILEGTRLSPPAGDESEVEPAVERREADVAPCVVGALAGFQNRLGVLLITPENGERVEALAHAAAGAGRLLVLDLDSLAFAVAALGRPLEAPYAVYMPSGVAPAIERGASLPAMLDAALKAAPRVVSAAEIAADPGAFLLRLSFGYFADLLDLNPLGGVIIQANGTPLGRFDPAWTSMEWWAARFGMTIAECGSSGHALPADLARLAEESGAPVVMAIHSRYPELMPISPDRLLLPLRGHRYNLADLEPSRLSTLPSGPIPTT